jgi:hypothetical protein
LLSGGAAQSSNANKTLLQSAAGGLQRPERAYSPIKLSPLAASAPVLQTMHRCGLHCGCGLFINGPVQRRRSQAATSKSHASSSSSSSSSSSRKKRKSKRVNKD